MPLPASKITDTMQWAANPPFPNGSENAGQFTLAFRIRHRRTNTLLKEHRLLLMPQRFTQTTEARTALYYTKGGIMADTPTPTGVGMTYFAIAGHTGFRGIVAEGLHHMTDRLALPATPESFLTTVQSVATAVMGQGRRPQQGSLIDGAAAIKDLQDTIRAYFFPDDQLETSAVTTQTQDLQLEFLNLTAPVSSRDRTGQVGWVIHPHRNLVDLQQDASKPFLYFYSFQFAGLRTLVSEETDDIDGFVEALTRPQTGLQATLRQLTQAVTDVTNGINTIEDAFTQMVIQNVTGPVSTFLEQTAQLGDAVGNFIASGAQKIQFPLYAQRTFAHVLDAPRHSVTTLIEAAKQLGHLLEVAADPRSLGTLLAGHDLVGGVEDALTLSLNHEPPVTLHLGTQTEGPQVAAAIQTQVQALPATDPANGSAYTDFTCVYDPVAQQYLLSGGTKLSASASVVVVTPPDPDFAGSDCSALLGLGRAHGGQEQPGSAYPVPALALLRGVEEACTHLQGFPDYFADQLPVQDAAVVALLPPEAARAPLQGNQRLRQTRITPGDTLQSIAARVGVDWQTLALVNRLTWPYILEEPTTLHQGRVSSATFWSVTDVTQTWPANVFAGQRLDLTSGPGAGQRRRILRHTPTELVLEQAWQVLPNDTTAYAIRSAANPIQGTGSVTSSTPHSLTDRLQALVPGSQRGLTLVLTSGPSAGERRPIADNTRDTYTVRTAWDVLPPPGSLYAILGPTPATQRQKLVGEVLSVPQPSARTPLPLRSRLQDVSAITGRQVTTEDQLLGRDLLLRDGALVYDPTLGDVVSVAGVANLRQAVIHLVNVPLGEIEYAPALGSFVQEELGLTATLPLQIQLLQSVERTIRQDPRIAAMTGAEVITQGGIALISFGATAVNGAAVERVTIR